MKLLKPSWVSHDGHPIFSVDFHPDGSRFATGGQGADTGRIVIWNMAPVLNEEDEKDENVPKLLCQLDNHLACVNCVRWSISGKFLASGGDDKVIMIWQSARYGNGSSGFAGGGNIEHWRCISSLRGHSGDILDLAWSPHDVWLASCSVDNSVIIWNANKWQEITAVLKGHTGLVKGISWDPVGRYMASQSDDKSLRIWRTHDWQAETVVTEPFNECGGTTHTLRLSWSPDGQYLVSAHAMNNSGPTAQIIERDGWKTNKDFVGHRKAITCVRFNPSILSKTNKDTGKTQHFCCCAIGSRDRSLSVWLTCLKRPLMVLHDLFSNSVLDISWSQFGYQLLVCSWDGTVAFLNFSQEEIGRPISAEDKSQLHQRLYGKSLSNHTSSAIIENPELLRLQEEHLKNQDSQSPFLQNGRNSNCEAKLLVKGPTDKQIETRMPDGRRRITPLFIPILPDGGEAPVPFNSRVAPTFSSSCEGKSKIVIEKRDESSMSQQSMNATKPNTSELPTSNHASNAASCDTPLPKTPQVKETTVPVSKQDNSSAAQTESTLPKVESIICTTPSTVITTTITTTTATTTTTTVTTSSASTSTSTTMAIVTSAVTPAVTPTPTVTSSCVTNKEPPRPKPLPSTPVTPTVVAESPLLDSGPIQVPVKKRPATDLPGRPPLEKKRGPGRPPLSQTLLPSPEKESRVDRASHGPSLHLPVLRVEKIASVHVPGTEGDQEATIEVENNVTAGPAALVHRLRRLVAGQPIWQALLDSRGAGVAASSSLACVVCEDSTLSVFSSTSGQRLRPAVVLSSPPTRLTCSGHRVMVITSRGNINVWDMRTMQCTVKNESLLPIMQAGGQDLSIRSTGLTDGGHPLVSLSTGRAYVYDTQLNSWLLVSSADSVLHQSCWHLGAPPKGDGKPLPLSTLQGQVHRNQRLSNSNGGGSRGLFMGSLQQAGSLSHLDAQVAAALSLHSAVEYRHWQLALAKFLTQEGLEDRVRELCDSLLGPPSGQSGTSGSWQPYILGIHRHDLLKEILPLVASNLRLQRLFVQYKEQLDLL